MSVVHTPEIVIVGGGPAGLSAAIALAQTGRETLVIDRATPPIDKACGEGLMPDSLEALQELGISLPAGSGFRFRGIRFSDAESSVLAEFPHGAGVGVRRPALHSLLTARAEQIGVKFLWGAKQVHLEGDAVYANRQIFRPRLVVAADGQNSALRRLVGLHQVVRERQRYGFRRHYRISPWSPYMELYWGPKFQIYITPVAPDEVCVASIARESSLRLQAALEFFPELQSRLVSAAPISSQMGSLSVSRQLRKVWRKNIVLLGDASGSVDAVTGEGMCLAFRQSLALAEALAAGDLRGYQLEHTRLSRRPRVMSALMLTLDRHLSFQKRALASLARHPGVFERLLAVHLGERPFSGLLSRDLVQFCRGFLAT